MRKKRKLLNLSCEQIGCFQSPVKVAIIAALRQLGPATIKEISSFIGKDPHALYYHVRTLEKVGLALEVGWRPTATIREAVYDLSAEQFHFGNAAAKPEYRETLEKFNKTTMAMGQRYYARALSKLPEHPNLDPLTRTFFVNCRLNPEQADRLRTTLDELMLQALNTHDPEGIPIVIIGVMAPVQAGALDDDMGEH
jgi:hypothetical protein